MKWNKWDNLLELEAGKFICGFCGDKIAAHRGYFYHDERGNTACIYICPSCGRPTFLYEGIQFPGPLLGRRIKKLPPDIKIIYTEIQKSIQNNCFTSAVLLGRKLIMHIAVNVAKAKEGENFIDYIEHLKKVGYVPPNTDEWLEYMRKLGNEKNHEIKIGKSEEAKKILNFIEMLLIFIYEFSNDSTPKKK